MRENKHKLEESPLLKELREKYVVTKEELEIVDEQRLLEKLYELQELRGYAKFFDDLEVHFINKIIQRLESSLENKQDILG